MDHAADARFPIVSSRAILAGVELMHMIRKGQFMMKGEGISLADQFYALTGQLRLA